MEGDDLVKRLNELATIEEETGQHFTPSVPNPFAAASAEITRLRARDTGWSMQSEEQQAELTRLTKLLGEAREALRPFADKAVALEKKRQAWGLSPLAGGYTASIKMKDLRNASAIAGRLG